MRASLFRYIPRATAATVKFLHSLFRKLFDHMMARKHTANLSTTVPQRSYGTFGDLPPEILDLIIRPLINEEEIRPMESLNGTCMRLRSWRLISPRLTPYISELLYGEGHLFLHHESFGKILHFSPYIRRLVVWLPVFIIPLTAKTFWAFGSKAPGKWELAFSKELQQFWDLFNMDTSMKRVWPTKVDKYINPKNKLGFQYNAFCTFQPCEEGGEDVRQWPSDEVVATVLHKVLPHLSSSTRIEVMRYNIYDDEMDSMWPCHEYRGWSQRVGKFFDNCLLTYLMHTKNVSLGDSRVA